MTLTVRAFVVTAAAVFAADSLFSWNRPKAEIFRRRHGSLSPAVQPPEKQTRLN